jgi:mannose-6-phosphate isomerase
MTTLKNPGDIFNDEIIAKPWGNETILVPKDLNYTFKIIHIKKGCRISLQSHDEKRETFTLVLGKASLITGLTLDDLQTTEMKLFRGYTIEVNTIHRLVAGKEEDAVIVEGSTAETGNTIRYQDDYNRSDETEEIRKKEDRGWK